MMKPVEFAPKTCLGPFLVEDVLSGKKSGALRALFKEDVPFGGAFKEDETKCIEPLLKVKNL
jgi:hypothetical protein